jgi:hypothetical protein
MDHEWFPPSPEWTIDNDWGVAERIRFIKRILQAISLGRRIAFAIAQGGRPRLRVSNTRNRF